MIRICRDCSREFSFGRMGGQERQDEQRSGQADGGGGQAAGVQAGHERVTNVVAQRLCTAVSRAWRSA